MLKATALALCLAAACFAVAEGTFADTVLYRWNDAAGNPVISDRAPPHGVPYTTLNNARYGVDRRGKNNASVSPDVDAAPNAKTLVAELPAATVVIEKRPELCERARDNVFKLETFPRIRVEQDNEVRFMTDEERAQQLETARKVVDANC